MPCKFDPSSPIIFEAVERVQSFMPHAKIVVHDSNSEDQSYLDDARLRDAEIILNNVGYETSAIWNTYKTFPDEDYYFFLHDSFLIKQDLSCFADKLLASSAWFPGDFWFEADQQIWCQNQLTINSPFNYNFHLNFLGIFGSIFGCSPDLLKNLKSKNIDHILPKNKMESQAMERLWGFLFCSEGYTKLIFENSIYGEVINIQLLNNEYFEKIIMRRQ